MCDKKGNALLPVRAKRNKKKNVNRAALAYFILSIKETLSIRLMNTMPAKKMIIESLFFALVLLTLKRIYPTSKLTKAQITFTMGDDSPLPGGSAKGVGKALPEMPLMKCGTTLAKKLPAKNDAT